MVKAWRFEGKGLALPAVVVIVGGVERIAWERAREWAQCNSVDPDSLRLVEREDIRPGLVAYGWNGDY